MAAFVIAAGCSFLVYRLVGNRLRAVTPIATNRVLVAAQDLQIGSIIKDADLTTTQIAGALPKGALVKREDAIGRGVISPIYQGEPVVDGRLAAVGSGGGLAATIRQGMRACAVKVDEVVGVAGFVTPGMRVDVLISGNPPGPVDPSEGSKVKTLLQDIEVLSAGTDIQKDGEGKPQQVHVVNLLVTPEQAELLSLASSETHIQLVLRNPLDTQVAETPGSAVGNLFSGIKATQKKPVVAHVAQTRPASQVYTVEVFNGSKKTEQKFGSGEEKQ